MKRRDLLKAAVYLGGSGLLVVCNTAEALSRDVYRLRQRPNKVGFLTNGLPLGAQLQQFGFGLESDLDYPEVVRAIKSGNWILEAGHFYEQTTHLAGYFRGYALNFGRVNEAIVLATFTPDRPGQIWIKKERYDSHKSKRGQLREPRRQR